MPTFVIEHQARHALLDLRLEWARLDNSIIGNHNVYQFIYDQLQRYQELIVTLGFIAVEDGKDEWLMEGIQVHLVVLAVCRSTTLSIGDARRRMLGVCRVIGVEFVHRCSAAAIRTSLLRWFSLPK
jgi:hypothetical protein